MKHDKPTGSKFTCCGCSKRVTVNNAIPQKRAFVWIVVASKKKKAYCYDCDDLQIQGVALPNDRR